MLTLVDHLTMVPIETQYYSSYSSPVGKMNWWWKPRFQELAIIHFKAFVLVPTNCFTVNRSNQFFIEKQSSYQTETRRTNRTTVGYRRWMLYRQEKSHIALSVGPSWSRSCGMLVGFTTTCTISAYHHWRCEFELRSGEVYSIQHYVIKFVNDLRQVCGFNQVLRFPPPIKPTATI